MHRAGSWRVRLATGNWIRRKAASQGFFWGIAAVGALICALFSTVTEIRAPAIGHGGLVARVNGEEIPHREYARALSAMQAGIKRPLTAKDEERALALLINEELIVQQAIDLGLAHEDRLIRKNLVQAMMRSVTSLDAEQPSEADLKLFFEQEKRLFAPPPLFSVAAFRVGGEQAARAMKTSLEQGADFRDLKNAAGVAALSVPARQPPGKLADLLGGEIADIVAQMQEGDIVGPLPAQDDFLFLWLEEKQAPARGFVQMRPLIEAEWQRRADERAFDAYTERLRKGARITIIAK